MGLARVDVYICGARRVPQRIAFVQPKQLRSNSARALSHVHRLQAGLWRHG